MIAQVIQFGNMKKLLTILSILAVAGFGCAKGPVADGSSADGSWPYINNDYGLQMNLPTGVEVRSRQDGSPLTKYLGFDADHFASLRDTVRDAKATNLAYFYAVPKLSPDDFAKALEASNAAGAVKAKSIEDVTTNGIAMKKITSTTEMGEDKIHYLFDLKDKTIIVSQFIGEEKEFDPIFATITIR